MRVKKAVHQKSQRRKAVLLIPQRFGGGIGVPPILQLSKELSCEKQIVVGYRNAQCFLKEDFEQNGAVYVATEDGYVTGKVDLGIDFTDITSDETAFYYGVNQTGCYVLSVDSGSNAEKAGVTRGDLVTKVNDTDVSSSSDITAALEKAEVGDTVTFTVSRRGTSKTISFVLEEYIPAVSNSQITNGSQKSTTPTSGYRRGYVYQNT